MPKPAGASQRYMPGLDGLRAIAVSAVIAYHLGLGWAQGGLLGVGVFFTLSGYLITDLLLDQHERLGAIQLGNFWLRRARRLLPALFVMLAVVVIWVALFDGSELATLRGNVLAAAVYISNWYIIAHSGSYFSRFAAPGPLDHLWSLAVEEQFYLLWPFMLWIGLRFIRNRNRMAAVTLGLAAISTILMFVLYQPGLQHDPTRVYEGTDTRAAGLLIGAALAMVWPSRRLQARLAGSRAGTAPSARPARRQMRPPPTVWSGNSAARSASERRPDTYPRSSRPFLVSPATVLLDIGGLLGLVIIGWLIWQTNQYSQSIYHGELLLLSLATAAVVAAAAHPASVVGKVLGIGPLRWVGVRSYGIYLWHYPIIVLTTPGFAKPGFWLGAAQVIATVAVAALSWRYVEEPIRRGALGTLWSNIWARKWQVVPPKTWGALGAVALVFIVAGCDLSAAGSPSATPTPVPTPIPTPLPHSSLPLLLPWTAGALSFPPTVRTSCKSVVYIGDSTSEGMISPDYLPITSQRLDPQLEDIGVSKVYNRISGARSIVEVFEGNPNGQTVAQQLRAAGYHGCWIIALGTNDAADINAGSAYDQAWRIQRMMSIIGKQPVMWVNVKTLPNPPIYYQESSMLEWNSALMQACRSHKNMRVFNWASIVQPSWFIDDDVHYTSTGYVHRVHATVLALARAFPAHGKSKRHSCLVQ